MRVGRATCSDLDNGDSVLGIGFSLMKQDVAAEDAGVMIGAAPPAFCKKHNKRLQQEMEDLSSLG